MAEFDCAQIAHWLGCPVQTTGIVQGFKQDSRHVSCGDLFFAIKGERVDGHQFLQEAAANGARCAVVETAYTGPSFGLQLMAVPDVLGALQRLAAIVHAQRNVRVVGVTGSVGKTTTKEFLATLLEGKYRVAKTPGNANSQVGVPLSILNSKGDEEVFVMEMGMSRPHEIERLVSIAPPEVGVITKIALAHAAFFPRGTEDIATAKAEILSHPKTRLGILNHQVAPFSAMQPKTHGISLTYGLERDGECDFVLCREGLNFSVREKGERTQVFRLPFAASHLCENFMGAAAAARAFGMSWAEIIPQAQKLAVYKNRFERVEKNGVVFINDSYNANPTSMRAALSNLPTPQGGGKRVAVLGAMKELGDFSNYAHLEVGELAFDHVDHLLCLGEECAMMVELFQKKGKPAEHFLDLESVKRRVFELIETGDVVLLKGSNSKQLWLVLE